MKRLSPLLLLLVSAVFTAHAQSGTASFYISILDPGYRPTVTGTSTPYTVQFDQHPELDAWVQQYGITTSATS